MPETPKELTAAEQQELAQQRELIEEQAAQDYNVGGGGAISDMQTQAYGHTYQPAPPNTNIAYSGSDTKAYIVTYGQVAKDSFIPLKNLSAISYSVHRDKAPVRRLGTSVADSYTKGTRTIAGSIVVINFDRAAFYELVAGVDVYGQAGAEIELADNIPPFDILLVFSEENKGRHSALWANNKIGPPKPDDAPDFSYMWIRNVHFVDEGSVTGTEEAYIETTFQYVAEHVEYMRPNNIFTETSDVGALQADLATSPSQQVFKRAEPYRIFLTQTDEIASYSNYIELMWLDGTKGIETINSSSTQNFTLTESDNVLDPTTCTCSDGVSPTEAACLLIVGNTWNCNKIYVPALRLAGTENQESIWRRQETRIDLSQPNFPAHLTNFTEVDFEITGKVSGTGDEMTPVLWESETLEPFAKRLTIKNAYFQPPPELEKRKWWRPFKPVVDDRPLYGNKFQNDLHNVGKQMYEELTETVNYDAGIHDPGLVEFNVQAGIIDQNLPEFENDLDDHTTGISSVGTHDVVRIDDDTLGVTLDQSEIQQEDTFTFDVELPIEDYTILDYYENMSNPPVNIEKVFSTKDFNAPHPFLNNDATLAHELVVDNGKTGDDRVEFAVVSQDYSGEGAAFTISCPPQQPTPAVATGSRPGPGISTSSKTFNHQLDGSIDKVTHTGDSGQPHVGPNPDENNLIQITCTHTASGMSLPTLTVDEWASYTSAGQEIGAGDNATPDHSSFDIKGYKDKLDAAPIQIDIQKTSVTETVTQPIGSYMWPPGTINQYDFPFVSTTEGSPGSEYIHSITSVDIDVSADSLPGMDELNVTYVSHDGDSFVASGARQEHMESLTTSLFQWGDGDVVLIPGFGPGHYDNYNIYGPITGGGFMTADAEFTNVHGEMVGFLSIPLELSGNDLIAKLGEATNFTIDSGAESGGMSEDMPLAKIPGDYRIHEIVTVKFWYTWTYKEQVPTGLTYVRTDPTPLTHEETLMAKADADISMSDIEISIQDENGQYFTDFSSNLDEATADYILQIGNIPPHLNHTITINYKFKPLGTVQTTINWNSYTNNSFISEVAIDLGPDEVVNFDTEGKVTLRCANSMSPEGFIDPDVFGITISPLVTSCSDNTSTNRTDCEAANSVWSNIITISDIPALTILNPNQNGWLGNIWNQLFGDPSQPQGNIDITVEYKNLVATGMANQLPIVIKYKYGRDPVNNNILTDLQSRGQAGVTFTTHKEYGPANAGGNAEAIKIVEPVQMDSSIGGTCSGGQCTGSELTPSECASCNGAWTDPSPPNPPNFIPTSGLPTYQDSLVAFETTDYTSMSNPPNLHFELAGIKALATADNSNIFPVTLSYHIQRGLLPIELTYVRQLTGDNYASVDLDVKMDFKADVPVLTAPALKANGDTKVGGGKLSGTLDKINQIRWIPEVTPGVFDSASAVTLQPAEETAIAGCSDPTYTDEASCVGAGKTWNDEAGSSFDVTDATKAYYLEPLDPSKGDQGHQIVFPTGINPYDATLQTSLNQVDPAFSGSGTAEYRIEVDYDALDFYIPPSKYTGSGYMITALLNMTGTVDAQGNALEVVVNLGDGATTGINYYRGKGLCLSPGSPMGVCSGGNYVNQTDCNAAGTCTVSQGGSDTIHNNVSANTCNGYADPNASPDPITVSYVPYTWIESTPQPYDTAADCVNSGNKWHFDDSDDIQLCETALTGKWLTSPGLQDPSVEWPQGICEIPEAAMNQLIDEQKLVQFSFMLVGPNAGPNGVGLDLYQHPERWTTMDEAIENMKKEFEKRFGPST